jgi:pyridoxamine 5'-phosphate oxidase
MVRRQARGCQIFRVSVPYERTLDEDAIHPDPVRQFEIWLDEARAAGEPMPNAMAVATTRPDGTPAVRMLLLESVDAGGFTFLTSLESPKADDLEALPRAAIAFWWPLLLRQVRLTGQVTPLPRPDVRRSFDTAPPGIQAMLRACHQGQSIGSRQELERLFESALAEYPTGGAPLPDHWGGYRLEPDSIEFWQGRTNRLQDRLRFTREHGQWRLQRLVP